MADHKYVRKYMGKSGKMIYVYKDTAGHETTLNQDEEGADESGAITSNKAKATISDAERRKEKFAAFYQKAVATGKEVVEASQEEAKKKSGGSGSSKKTSSSKQQADVSASSGVDPTVEDFARKIMSRSLLYEDIPPQYQTKVKTFVESVKATGMPPNSETVAASSEQKQDASASSSRSASAANNKAVANTANVTTTQKANASSSTDTQKSSSSTASNKAAATSSNATTTQKATTSSSTATQKSSSGGVSGGGAGRSGHADTTVKMSDVKADSSIITKAVDWVKKLFGK